MEKHYATIWESITDVIGDREALVHGDKRLTWSQYDDRASRLAQALSEAGLGADSKIGLYLYNSNEYLNWELFTCSTIIHYFLTRIFETRFFHDILYILHLLANESRCVSLPTPHRSCLASY